MWLKCFYLVVQYSLIISGILSKGCGKGTRGKVMNSLHISVRLQCIAFDCRKAVRFKQMGCQTLQSTNETVISLKQF